MYQVHCSTQVFTRIFCFTRRVFPQDLDHITDVVQEAGATDNIKEAGPLRGGAGLCRKTRLRLLALAKTASGLHGRAFHEL